MALNFQLVYHEKVKSEDIPRISLDWKIKIRKAIEVRLTAAPELYGKPLRQSLANYRKLRVGNYRIIFRIENMKVKIFVIAHRKIAYDLIYKRI